MLNTKYWPNCVLCISGAPTSQNGGDRFPPLYRKSKQIAFRTAGIMTRSQICGEQCILEHNFLKGKKATETAKHKKKKIRNLQRVAPT